MTYVDRLRLLAVYLGLVEDEDDAWWHRRECRAGRHEWLIWQRDVTAVPLVRNVALTAQEQVGWEYIPISGPSYRCCRHCPAMERKVTIGTGL